MHYVHSLEYLTVHHRLLLCQGSINVKNRVHVAQLHQVTANIYDGAMTIAGVLWPAACPPVVRAAELGPWNKRLGARARGEAATEWLDSKASAGSSSADSEHSQASSSALSVRVSNQHDTKSPSYVIYFSSEPKASNIQVIIHALLA